MVPRRPSILVIEDEEPIALAVGARLRSEGFEVCGGGRHLRPGAGRAPAAGPGRARPDAPRHRRTGGVPAPAERASGAGAHAHRPRLRDRPAGGAGGRRPRLPDQPFSPRELVARIRTILRRVERASRQPERPLRLGPIEADPASRRVHRAGRLWAHNGSRHAAIEARLAACPCLEA